MNNAPFRSKPEAPTGQSLMVGLPIKLAGLSAMPAKNRYSPMNDVGLD
jgi:hypothetical protein